MSTPVHVTFRHMSPRAELEEYAREHASRLHRFHRRIVDCRVQFEPNAAGVLRVVVELTLPRERLVASYESDPDRPTTEEGRAQIAEYRWLLALDEAFETAGRILRAHAGRMAGRG